MADPGLIRGLFMKKGLMLLDDIVNFFESKQLMYEISREYAALMTRGKNVKPFA